MLIKNKKIAIVGGGPGGLTLARLLQLKGAEVKVYERDFNSDVRVQGATLDLHEESGLEALRRAGLIDAFYANHRPEAGKLRILDKNLNVAMDTHSADDYEENRPEIDRGPLRNILLDSLQPDTVVWDSQFLSMSPKNESWELTFKNGSKAEADIVIAADGANSKIRPHINSIKPIYSGVTIVEGNIYDSEKNAPKLYKLVNGGKIFAFGDEKTLILSMKGDGTLSFYTGCKVDEFWVRDSSIDFSNKDEVYQWFKKEFGSWDPVWQELFESDEMSIIPRPQYHFPLDQQWDALPNLTMLGDAAHRMPPYAGEGVNMAMQDAFELAEVLSGNNFPNIQEAIATYEKQMCKRASEITKITLDSTEMMHSDDPITKLINMFNGVDEVEH
ncbi:NAD(P)/FAD-dependent oxidoreductase [Flavobacterium sp. AJR]|uniref:FAD-dependent oxidoreductase n=1 Tax=Flavobacterium sp. AJR TaxID=1979369 RepID=UPI000A3D7BB8|nr:NAD(P)/FAD-dependent oxidoreductase [Flavobacterium sp. AJR]OUL62081.1 2-polyprenyl-6-methoxyphenol hydroxylase [Flavobacterium sp. AJR]